MSEICKDRAIVLRTFDYGETSRIVVALTRAHGKMRFIAKGARNTRSPFAGRLRTGNIGEIVFYDKPDRGLQLLGEMESAGLFDSGGEDLEKLCILQAGLDVAGRSVIEREADSGVFDLLEDFMGALLHATDPWAIFFALEMLLLEKTGHFPFTGTCHCCRREIPDGRFGLDPLSGSVVCPGCSDGEDILLSPGSCETLAAILHRGFEAVAEGKMEPSVRKELGRLLHKLFLHHVEGYRLPGSLKLIRGDKES